MEQLYPYNDVVSLSAAQHKDSDKKVYCINGNEFASMSFKQYQDHLAKVAFDFDPKFVMDSHFKKICRILFLYFWEDPKFESEGHGSLKKGLLITGNVGVGKTMLFRMFRSNPRSGYRCYMVNANKVADYYQEQGVEALTTEFGCGDVRYPKTFFFDDLGCERTSVKHMGNELNAMERIILQRYEYKALHSCTHFTSNLDGEGIEQLYGTRVRSRLREMVNMFQLTGTDRRK